MQLSRSDKLGVFFFEFCFENALVNLVSSQLTLLSFHLRSDRIVHIQILDEHKPVVWHDHVCCRIPQPKLVTKQFPMYTVSLYDRQYYALHSASTWVTSTLSTYSDVLTSSLWLQQLEEDVACICCCRRCYFSVRWSLASAAATPKTREPKTQDETAGAKNAGENVIQSLSFSCQSLTNVSYYWTELCRLFS